MEPTKTKTEILATNVKDAETKYKELMRKADRVCFDLDMKQIFAKLQDSVRDLELAYAYEDVEDLQEKVFELDTDIELNYADTDKLTAEVKDLSNQVNELTKLNASLTELVQTLVKNQGLIIKQLDNQLFLENIDDKTIITEKTNG